MKTLALAMILLPAIALADYDDGYANDDDYPRLNQTRRILDDEPRADPLYPSPMLPNLNRREYGPRPGYGDPGGTYFGPHQWCRSDGSNTFCFNR